MRPTMGFAKLSMLGLLALATIVVGAWAVVVSLAGPLFGFGMNGVAAWSWNPARIYLSLAPGAVGVLSGLLLLISIPSAAGGRGRFLAGLGGLLALLAGAWLVIGPGALAALAGGGPYDTNGGGSAAWSFMLSLGYHAAPGLLLVAFGTWAWGLLPHSRMRRDQLAD